jgi:REP element-mobilizing transposase RayT
MGSFFDWNQRVDVSRRVLPHWSQKEVTCFVTFRLADSVPKRILRQWAERKTLWLAENPPPHDEGQQQAYDREFTRSFHQFLDAGHGDCIFKGAVYSQIVADALSFFDGARYRLGLWVVMPNHVHVLFRTLDDWTPEQILHSWKSFSAKQINLARKSTGQVWQHESYDRIVRSAEELLRIETYIRDNPKNAGIEVAHASWLT